MEFLGKKTSLQIILKNPNKSSKSKKKKTPATKGPWPYREDMLLKNGQKKMILEIGGHVPELFLEEIQDNANSLEQQIKT